MFTHHKVLRGCMGCNIPYLNFRHVSIFNNLIQFELIIPCKDSEKRMLIKETTVCEYGGGGNVNFLIDVIFLVIDELN